MKNGMYYRTHVTKGLHCYRSPNRAMVIELRRTGSKPATTPWFKVATTLSKTEAMILATELLAYATGRYRNNPATHHDIETDSPSDETTHHEAHTTYRETGRIEPGENLAR